MEIEVIKKRIDTLKAENDQANGYVQNLNREKEQAIANILVRNGRIMELEAMLKILFPEKSE